VVTPDRFGESADGLSLYPTEGYCLRVYPSSTLSMLKIVIVFCFFYRAIFTSTNKRKISRKINIAYRKISYNRNPDKKTRVFERACIVAKRGQIVQFLREICPFKNLPPKVNSFRAMAVI
jgi:hypothetical protein